MTTRNSRKVLWILPLLIGSALFTLLPLKNTSQVRVEDLQLMPSIAENPPYGTIQLSNETVYRGETLEYNITAAAIGWRLEELYWSVDIQNFTGGNWINISDSPYNFQTKFYSPDLNWTWYVNPATVSAGDYRVILWIKNGTDNATLYKDFKVLNNKPIFHSISANTYTIDRMNSFNVTVNVTDVEIADLAPNGGIDGNIWVKVHYRDTNGNPREVRAHGLGNGNYSALITIEKSFPIGVYTFWVGIQDYMGMELQQEVLSDTFLVTIKNINPSFDIKLGLIINDKHPSDSGTNITVRRGETINITIIASDPENSVRFVLIKLQHSETDRWENYTMDYQNFPHTLIIDSSDLAVGMWAIWITVIDEDGGITTPAAAANIEILADTWTIAAPIVFFLIGMFVGMAIGMAVLSWRSHQKAPRLGAETPTETGGVSPVVEKARKIPAQAEPTETEEEEEKTPPEEEEGENKTQMKRKIRRRIN